EVPSPESGKLVELKVSEGDEVGEGDVIGVVELASEDEGGESDEGDSGDEGQRDPDEGRNSGSGTRDSREDGAREADESDGSERAADARSEAASRRDDLPPPPVPFEAMDMDPSKLPHASPSVRRLARQLGVDLSGVSGSGRKDRITEDDLKAHVKQVMDAGAAAAPGPGLDIADPPRVDFAKFGEIEEEKLSRIKQISGPNLHRNWVSIPHVTQFDEADVTEMEAFRKANRKTAEEAGTKMTPLVFLIKAVVAGLKEFPHFNASLSDDGKKLIKKRYFHIGVAVDTPNGLVVPVIRDADQKGLLELASELTDLSVRAREGKLKPGEMQGGCFSISSLGGIGGTAFTPIINAPELAILGVSRSRMKPMWDGEQFTPRLMLPLSLSYDHRVIDGADAARFTRYLANQLEDLRRLLL
ncbi:MAG TPA: 2-oxo acid dehydrogenase subunit E2, partial [Wenzhouxiangella sp.]|nr:2-oxo acid dehydrogenase subunit E2 [Wenzhouxiangella sp.]